MKYIENVTYNFARFDIFIDQYKSEIIGNNPADIDNIKRSIMGQKHFQKLVQSFNLINN